MLTLVEPTQMVAMRAPSPTTAINQLIAARSTFSQLRAAYADCQLSRIKSRTLLTAHFHAECINLLG